MNEQWWRRAPCRDMDPELFSPSRNSPPGGASRALAACNACPVREACRDDMLQVRPSGPHSIIAGGWRWDDNGRATPYAGDWFRAEQIVEAARRRARANAPRLRASRACHGAPDNMMGAAA
jgi:hypothetical protein